MKKRQNGKQKLGTRSLRLRMDAGGKPASLDEATRSVEITCATETDTVMVYDWELGRVPEILLMSGYRPTDQVPLLDTHSREGVANVLGSVRELRVESDELIGRAYYSSVQAADDAFTKTRENHLTDYSACYRPISTTVIAESETVSIGGRSFTGPCLVITDWELKEVSTCPIGADNRAKARALETTNEEDEEMNEFLRKMRVKLALAEDATEDQIRAAIEKAAEDSKRTSAPPAAPAVAKPADPKPAPDPIDLEEAARKAVADDRVRSSEITMLCEAHGCRELANEMIRNGVSVAEAQRKVLDVLTSRGTAGPSARLEYGADERDKFRAAATDGLGLRVGQKLDKPAEGAVALVSYSLRELARECLVRANQSAPNDIRDMVQRALTTSDLPNILSNVANKSLLASFESQPETYMDWADDTGSLSDFKLADLVRRGETSDLEEVKEDGEFKYGKTSDTKEQARLLTFGKIIPITRQAIINDDTNSLSTIPADMGEAVARLLGDLVYGVLIANANMADGKALFHTSHKNLASQGAAVSVASLNEAELAMGLQKDLLGKRSLNIPPKFFIAPLSLKGLAEQFFTTQLIGGAENQPNKNNPWFGPKLTRIYDTRLDADDTAAWYMAAMKGRTIRLFFLNGQKTPYMEQRVGFDVDGIQIKVRMDAAAKAIAWTGLYKNPGASA
jgi:hypothetical protein